MNRGDSSLVREDRCHTLVVDQGRHHVAAAIFGVQNLLMSSPAVFDLDACVFFFRCDEYVDRFGSLLNLGQHWSDCSSRHN